MGKQYDALSEPLLAFIAAQKVFFAGTATADSLVNVSPKGMDSFRALSNKMDDGLRHYWEEKNQLSIDNIPTNIIEKNVKS